MTQPPAGLTMDDVRLTLEEFACSCAVSREWVIERVDAGLLGGAACAEAWTFGSRDILRARRLYEIERSFDANPELAGLVADLFEELALLRARTRRVQRHDDAL